MFFRVDFKKSGEQDWLLDFSVSVVSCLFSWLHEGTTTSWVSRWGREPHWRFWSRRSRHKAKTSNKIRALSCQHYGKREAATRRLTLSQLETIIDCVLTGKERQKKTRSRFDEWNRDRYEKCIVSIVAARTYTPPFFLLPTPFLFLRSLHGPLGRQEYASRVCIRINKRSIHYL